MTGSRGALPSVLGPCVPFLPPTFSGKASTSGGGAAGGVPSIRLENPCAAQHGSRAIGIGRHHQDAAFAQKAEAIGIGKSHTTETVATNVRNAVVQGQTFIDESVVCDKQIGDVPVFIDDALDEQVQFACKGGLQALVEIGKDNRVWNEFANGAQVQPLESEVLRHCMGLRILQHSPHLLLEDCGRFQLAGCCSFKQFVIRALTPQKEGKPGCELQVVDRENGTGRGIARDVLSSVEKLRAGKNQRQRTLDARIEASRGPRILEKRKRGCQIFIRDRPPIRLPGDVSQNLCRASRLFSAACARWSAYR